MYQYAQLYGPKETEAVHQASLAILAETGVWFGHEPARELFRRHGARVDGSLVRLDEGMVQKALDQTPRSFVIKGRDRERDLRVDVDALIFAPGCGPVQIAETDGGRRESTWADYRDFCKLVHTSEVVGLNGYLMVFPTDLPADVRNRHMLLANLTLSDKPFLADPNSPAGIADSLEMTRMMVGELNEPYMAILIGATPPLQYLSDMARALIEYARAGQVLIIHGGGIMGANAPIQLAGQMVNQNAMVLAGLTLAQLVRPSTPVIYGASGTALDMATGSFRVGGPEPGIAGMAGLQMAKYYGLPCRGQGCANDAQTNDVQAGVQSATVLMSGVLSGLNVVIQACGTLDGYMAMSFEKFLIDEELCAIAARFRNPPTIAEKTMDLEAIRTVGPGGTFLSHPTTVELCRTAFFTPKIFGRPNYAKWTAQGRLSVQEKAAGQLAERLAEYIQPNFDPALVRDMERYAAVKVGVLDQ